uniref:Peroxidase n=1 Tax=Anoplophora glabripennis TaxID=217634 RepID=V5I8I5_ANOGL
MCLAVHFLGMSVWVLSHADTFATANTSSMSSITGFGNSYIESKYSNLPVIDLGIKITEKDLNNSVVFANSVLNNMKRLETSLGWSDIRVKTGTPSHGMFISFSPEREAIKLGRDALVAMKASVQLLNSFCNKHNLNHHACARYLTSFKFSGTPLNSSCTRMEKRCSHEEYLSPYRSIDGSCNHISNGKMGESFTGFTRLLYPDYLDGIHEPRRAVNRNLLPSPRSISLSVVDHVEKLDEHLTLAVMQWGQFLEHDLSRPATAVMIHTEKPIECCSAQGKNLSPRYIHPFCSPVYASTKDNKRYTKKSLDCMNYVRSIPALRSDCSFGPSDQVNQATHFLDGSQIYGSTYRKSNSLRSFISGKLEMSDENYLPMSQNPMEDCQVNSSKSFCYKSGDSRVNFQPQLTAMHTIWFREHNRVAEELANINSHWEDDILFQETRRIVVAEMQHITYNEWIKKILSSKYRSIIEAFSIFDENIDPSVSNSFATATMRSLKSLYDGNIKLFNENREANSSLSLQKYFNNPNKIQQPGILDALIRGLATQSSQKIDRHFAEDLINKLYTNGHFGFDVLSMDIQRGRDHGLPGYTQYRTLCGLRNAENFNDFSDVMPEKHINILSETYSNPKDVDLIVGGILENVEEGSIFGPTFSCIIADQFMRTKKGDRYFYTNEIQPKPFSVAQLNEIKKVTLARIFCDNGNNITSMQRDAFEKVNTRNNLVSCEGEDIPRLSLSLWEESRGRYFH